MVATTLLRAPKYLNAVRLEHKALEHIIKEYKINLVISDNRYGLWTKKVPCVFICHQLALIPPKILDWTTPLVYRLHGLFMDRFNEIWIPDFEGRFNLSGRLSHQYPLTKKMKFIGSLSRFGELDAIQKPHDFGEVEVVCVLSGPEPQRTLLEEKIIEQSKLIDRNILIVQGKTEEYKLVKKERLTLVSFLTSEKLEAVIKAAKVIIARSGYSTVMDLSALGKKAILIPTPGQTEQVYLANNLSDKNIVVVEQQDDLDLKRSLGGIKETKGFPKLENDDLLKEVMANFINQL